MFKNVDKVFIGNEGFSTYAGDSTLDVLNKFNGAIIENIYMENDELVIVGNTGTIYISDEGQSCCECRYMHCEDEADFDYHIGSTFRFCRVSGYGVGDGGGDVHELAFCDVLTSKGVIQLVCHNEHNGYYGGFSITVRGSFHEKEEKSQDS